METTTSSQTERGLLFWVFLGPLSLLLSLTLLSLKAPDYFLSAAAAALIGISITWAFRLKGLFFALFLLVSTAFYHAYFQETGVSLWFSGSLITLAFSCFITLLTLEEAGSLLTALNDLAFSGTEEKEALRRTVQSLEFQNSALQNEIKKSADKKDEMASLEKVNELARIELLSSMTKLEEMEKNFVALRREKGNLEEALEASEAKVAALQDAFEKWQREKVKGEEMTHLIDRLSREKDLFESTLSRIQEELEVKEEALKVCEQKLAEEKQKVPALEPLSDMPPATEGEFRRLFGMHKQLRDQFALKSAELDQARKALFQAQEEAETASRKMFELEHEESPQVKALTREIDHLLAQNDTAQQEIAALEHLLKNDGTIERCNNFNDIKI